MQPPPTALPPHVLERDDVRRAFACHDFGEAFCLIRKWGGISYNKIAEACGIKPVRVGQIARGQARITSHEKIEHIADVLRIPGQMLRLAPRPWESADSHTAAPLPALRRADNAAMLTADPGPWEVAELVRRTQATDVSPAELETIEIALDGLCRAYPHMSARQLHTQTRHGLRHVTQLLEGRTTLAQHRDLLVSAGWLFLLAGCVEYDLGQRQAAELSRAAALRIGQETDHGEIQAWSWELGAWFALTQGRLTEVIDCVEAGHHADSTNSVGVQLYAQGAKAYARMGDFQRVRSTLDAGRARLERLPRPDHPEHHFVIDPEKWDFYEMDAHRLLSDDAQASIHANEVIRISTAPDGSNTHPMRVAEAQLTLGVAAARSREIEEAVDIGSHALTTERKSIPSLLQVARELNDELQQRYPREAATREFRDRMHQVSRTAQRAVEG